MQTLELEGGALKQEYARFNYRIYELATPMQPGERRQLRFETLLEERGFPNDNPLTRIVENGTCLNNYEIAPTIGMDRDGLLQDRAKRRKHGLPPELRPAKLEDEAANEFHYLRRDSDWVTAELTLTTDIDQTPIAPGYTVSDTVRDGRRTLVTRTDVPIMHFFSIQSARYAQKKDTWRDRDGKTVELAVYYHPEHEHNVQRMLDAMKRSLEIFSERFSPFQFHQLRILEFPAYESFAQSFANTVPYSERIGFIQNYDEQRSDEMIDLVTYVTAHEVAHQWWAHQIIGAYKQGMTLLSETLAQYSALLVMEALYGPEQIRKFLKGELDGHLRSRGGEILEELPLVRVENQPYIHSLSKGLTRHVLAQGGGRRGGRESSIAPSAGAVRLQAGAVSVIHRLSALASGRGRPGARSAHRGSVRTHHVIRHASERRTGTPLARRTLRSRLQSAWAQALRRRARQGNGSSTRRAVRCRGIRRRARQEGLYERSGFADATSAYKIGRASCHARRRQAPTFRRSGSVQQAHRSQLR